MLRAAVIGCGKIGSQLALDPLLADDVFTHAAAYEACPDTELVALCDTDGARLSAAGSHWNVAALHTNTSFLMAAEAPDIVSICTPTPSHAGVLREILSAPRLPKAVLCEKPLALTLAESYAMETAASEKGVVLATVFMRRYATNLRALRDFIRRGEIGDIQAVSGLYMKGTFHSGTHWFDLLRFLAGEVAWVEALDLLGEEGEDPTLDILLSLQSGALATLRACDHRHYTIFEMDILGTSGRVRITDSGHQIDLFRPRPSPRYSGYTELAPASAAFGDRRNLMLHAVEDMVGALSESRQPASSAADGIAAARIADAAMRSGGDRITLMHITRSEPFSGERR